MLPVLFRVGPLAVYSYGLMLAGAFLACWVLARWYLARCGVDGGTATDLLLAAAIGGIVGARALYVATNWEQFAGNLLWIPMLQRGGMVFYGGLAGGALAVLAYTLWRRLPLAVVADGAALAVPLGSAIGRLGCFLNGCCAGVPTTAWYGITFPGGTGPVIPTQLLDAVSNGLILAALLHVFVRRSARPGTLWWAYLALYGISRFGVESLRVNPPIALGLSQAQWISMPVFVAGVAGLLWMRCRRPATKDAA
jgi:phosphatidylglycerol:prolipoprotein diacylglycerol transferase